MKSLTDATLMETINAREKHGSNAAAARALDLNRSTVIDRIALAKKRGLVPKKSKPKQKAKLPEEYERNHCTQTRDGLLIDVESLHKVVTGADAIKKAGFDLVVWEPVKVECTSWEVAVKLKDSTDEDAESIVVQPLWRVKVTCARRVSAQIEDAAEALAKRSFGKGLKLPKVRHKKRKEEKTLILGLVDHHFGKLCWEPETGNNYDTKIAEQLWMRAVDYILQNADGVTEIILPIGNDFGHVDGKSLQTTAGTDQGGSHDGRYEKVSDLQETALIYAVQRAIEVAPVHCLHVPGNHDRNTSRWLCKCVQWAFNKSKHVSMDLRERETKYVHRGNCLWGFAHGDGPKRKSLKDMMPVEASDEWAASKACREWMTGHLHQQYASEKISTQEEAGMVFRTLPSLCGTDAWHFSNGFSLSQKATQSYLYSNQWGLEGFINAPSKRLAQI